MKKKLSLSIILGLMLMMVWGMSAFAANTILANGTVSSELKNTYTYNVTKDDGYVLISAAKNGADKIYFNIKDNTGANMLVVNTTDDTYTGSVALPKGSYTVNIGAYYKDNAVTDPVTHLPGLKKYNKIKITFKKGEFKDNAFVKNAKSLSKNTEKYIVQTPMKNYTRYFKIKAKSSKTYITSNNIKSITVLDKDCKKLKFKSSGKSKYVKTRSGKTYYIAVAPAKVGKSSFVTLKWSNKAF